MTIRSLFSIFGSSDMSLNLNSYSYEAQPQETQPVIWIEESASGDQATASETVPLSEEFEESDDQELDSFVEEFPPNQPYYIDESQTDDLLELDHVF